MTVSADKRNCPLCGAAASQARPLAYRTAEFQVVQCGSCDLAFLDQLPPQHEFEDERAWEVSSVSYAAQRKRAYPVMTWLQQATRYRMHLMSKCEPKRILARLVRAGPVIDVGCGTGLNLIPPPDGFVPYGIENLGFNGGIELSATWVPNGTNTSSATYSIYEGSPVAADLVGSVTVNQQNKPEGTTLGNSIFQDLGVYYPINSLAGFYTIVLNAQSSTPGGDTVSADAVALVSGQDADLRGVADAWGNFAGEDDGDQFVVARLAQHE